MICNINTHGGDSPIPEPITKMENKQIMPQFIRQPRKIKLNDLFQTVRYINLANRTDRQLHIEKQLFKNAIIAERIEGVNAKAEGITPMRACTLSHAKCIENSVGNVFVFEDDVVISKFYRDEIKDIIKYLPEDWDIFYLGANHRSQTEYIKGHLARAVEPYCTHAIGYSERFKERAYELLMAYPYSPDQLMADLVQSGQVNAYCANPSLAWQMPNYSDIEGREMNYDFMIPKREL